MRVLGFVFVLFIAVGLTQAQSAEVAFAFEKGKELATIGKFAEAEKQYSYALSAAELKGVGADRLAILNYNIGVCFFRSGRTKDAADYFRKALKLTDDGYAKASYALGMAELANGELQIARSAFAAALKHEPKNGEWWFDLAFVYLAERDHKNAVIAFQKSIDYKSVDSAISHNNVGVIFALDRDFEAAESEFKLALEESGGNFAEARSNLDFCLTARRDTASIASQLRFVLGNRDAI